ncbi:hypothetical protein EST38_g4553 [Candolleomyces aberdarensis]|uniref:Transcription factor domain-containing protein n=1 Tax=Candolleomyces aberdarensis TaxID=2316362 RepID=A0A4Q2DQY8_9AGAR|nr:hypothetical protein EST38_g4553 [Candolleomyces aberdarensis]
MEPPRDPSGAPQPPRPSFEIPTVPADRARAFPPLPGFAPPPHKYASYGIVPSTAASSEDESEDTLPRSTINAPIEALQGLANAAAEAAAAPAMSPRVKKRKRAEPTPRNAFPHVVEKGLVTDAEARELFNIFFAGCHLFIPLFDPSYDTYESLQERSPWTFDAILAIAAKIRSGNGPLTGTFYKCLEEAQGIARSSLFGPVVRKEAVQGMLLLAAWSTNGWLPSGHAMRMALDLGLHRALEKLAEDTGKQRTEEEERNLAQIYETLVPLNGQVNHNAHSVIKRAGIALDKWWTEHNELHRKTMNPDSLLLKLLAGEHQYAKLWLVCLALQGVAWDKMPFDQRELAFEAKDAASNCLAIFLSSSEYRSVPDAHFRPHQLAPFSDMSFATPIRAALRYAVHDSLVTAAFSGLFLLKMANLFPRELDLASITAQVEQMAQLLSDVAAERYAFTLRIMLANLRRKVGMPGGINTSVPTMPPPSFAENMVVSPTNISDPSMPPPFTMEELGFAWPNENSFFSPAAIPPWLQEQSLNDLGLPVNGSDGIFLQTKGTNGWSGDFPPMPEAW